MSYRGPRAYPQGTPQGNLLGHETLEDTNEEMEGELRGKVDQLKYLSINIGNELKEQKKLIGEIDDGFDNTSSIITNTIGKVRPAPPSTTVFLQVGKLLKSHSNYHIHYLLLFCIFVFLVLWLFVL